MSQTAGCGAAYLGVGFWRYFSVVFCRCFSVVLALIPCCFDVALGRCLGALFCGPYGVSAFSVIIFSCVFSCFRCLIAFFFCAP